MVRPPEALRRTNHAPPCVVRVRRKNVTRAHRLPYNGPVWEEDRQKQRASWTSRSRGAATEEPKGHALLYFLSSSDPDELWASYIMVLPITVDISKYVPPFLMSQVKELGPQDLSAFAFPPAPERLGGRDTLDKLAEARNDDVLFGGSINPEDVPTGMMAVNEAMQHYTEIYSNVVGIGQPPEEQEEEEDDGAPGVSEVMYGLMSDGDKLNELTKLVSRLRFGIEGDDSRTVSEAEQDITVLSRHLPANHGVDQLVQAVKSSDEGSAELAALYVQRCFHLVQEDYARLPQIEAKILALETKLGT